MLQFITGTHTFSVKQQVEMMLKAGCKWIEYHPDKSHKDEILSTAKEILPMCRNNDCILTISKWIDIASEANLDGVNLELCDSSASTARKELGEKAIIGVNIHTFDDMELLNLNDIDYIQLGEFSTTGIDSKKGDLLGFDDYRNFVLKCQDKGISTPIVAIGTIAFNDIEQLMNSGINGIAMCHTILMAQNPVDEAEKIISLLKSIKGK